MLYDDSVTCRRFHVAATINSRSSVVLLSQAPAWASARNCAVAKSLDHGSVEPGATIAQDIREFPFDLAVARALRMNLEANGFEPTMVRKDRNIARAITHDIDTCLTSYRKDDG